MRKRRAHTNTHTTRRSTTRKKGIWKENATHTSGVVHVAERRRSAGQGRRIISRKNLSIARRLRKAVNCNVVRELRVGVHAVHVLRVCSVGSAALHVGYVPATEVGAREYGGAGGGGGHGSGHGGDGEAHCDCFCCRSKVVC